MNLKRATSVAFFVLTTLSLSYAGIGLAQEAVYRCGNQYTNDADAAKRADCQRLAGGASVTIPAAKRAIEVKKPTAANNLSPSKNAAQQARDADAKRVIEAELKKTETQLVDWRKQYAGLSAEQDLEKKLALKQQIARGEADVVSLKRELKR